MTTTYELYTNDGGTPVAVGGTSPAIVERVENLENESATKSELAGKEDKGVCLPLTGGVLSGHLELDPNFEGGNINIGFNFDDRIGSGVGFRSINYAEEPGAFSIFARDLTQTTTLNGRPDGTLTWGNKPVVCQVSTGGDLESGFYIRYSDGTQICANRTKSDFSTDLIRYPVPFITLFSIIIESGRGAYAEDWGPVTTNVVTVNGNSIGHFAYFAIGTWK